jgi:hypothetical protein
MISNFIEMRKGFRRISVEKNNTVKITVNRGKSVDEPEGITTKLSRRYQIITSVTVGDETFLQCLGRTSIDVYSINHCEMICTVDKNSKIGFLLVAGEAFVKVTEDNGTQRIYDSISNLMASEKYDDINVVFAGCGACLQKVDKKSGVKHLYTFEGSLIA